MRKGISTLLAGLVLLASLPLAAADFELGNEPEPVQRPEPEPARKNVAQRWSQDRSSGQVPSLTSLGDVPSAYTLLKYELAGDLRFYEGGGIMAKAMIGIWPRFFFGGGVNVRNFVGAGDLSLGRDDATMLARLLVVREMPAFPAISLGWDGPAYAGGEMRGLYLVASKELSTALGYFQVHGGLNTNEFEAFVTEDDLRAFAAASTMVANVLLFAEFDELLHPDGARINTGVRLYFDPISLGLEFQDLGSTRSSSTRVSRMLRVSYTGLF